MHPLMPSVAGAPVVLYQMTLPLEASVTQVDPMNVGLEAAVPRVLYFQEFTVIGTATTGLEPVTLDIPTHDVVAPTCEGGIGRPYLLEASNTWAASPLQVTSNIFITTNVPV